MHDLWNLVFAHCGKFTYISSPFSCNGYFISPPVAARAAVECLYNDGTLAGAFVNFLDTWNYSPKRHLK